MLQVNGLDAHDLASIVRYQIRLKESMENFREYPTTEGARIALICVISNFWPKCQKKRVLRLALLMALLGRPILTQNDLKYHETKILLEVLNDESTKQCFGPSSREGLQMEVEGLYFGKPWTFPHTRPA